ncbi:MAG TPA: hypothetical protein VI456_00735 [Polyangia bacterium]
MLYPLIGPRLHGWLDDLVAATYLVGILLFHLHDGPRAAAIAGAALHFTLTRLTNYPQGTFKLIPFRTHAFIELGEGLGVLAAAALLAAAPASARLFLGFMGLTQLGAFAFSDYATPT